MGWLNPLFLLAAAAVAVPLVLHLFHRHESRTVLFPALRYLLRTEREHARRIRTRQLLLLVVRVLTVLVLVAAGARLFLRGRGAAHLPTALVLIVDNSLSSGRVVGDERVLDRLRELADASLDAAAPEDRIWVIRAGEPWEVAVPGPPAQARRRVAETEVTGTRGDLDEALRRAAGLVRESDLPAAEIQLLSDLQASAFGDGAAPADGVPVVVFTGIPEPGPNHYLRDASAGGGLPPLANRRTDVTVALGGSPTDTAAVTVRLLLEARVRGATSVRPGGSAVLPVGPFPTGSVQGYAEADPDELRADDRRYLAFDVRPPPRVESAGDPGTFAREALAVLEEGGRLAAAGPSQPADVLLAGGGAGIGDTRAARRIVVPPADPALLPALNRRLADAQVPWRYESLETGGEAGVGESRVPLSLDGVRVRRHYRLAPPEGAPPSASVLVRLSDGEPWLISEDVGAASYLLLGSPLDADATTLPVDAAMVPFLEWALSGWGAAASAQPRLTGEALPLPSAATEVESPDGTRTPVDGTSELRTTRDPGIYTILREDSVLARVALNASVRESLLDPLPQDALQERVGDGVISVATPRAWSRETFTSRQGHELWRPLLLAALLLLLLESWMASSGSGRTPERRPSPTSAADNRSAPLP